MEKLKSILFDPLRIHGAGNIAGDVLVILSGVGYGNPVRSLSAFLGLSTHFFAAFYGSKRRIFGLKSANFVMGVVFCCGFLYVLSGLNIFDFEKAPRYTEALGGLFLMLATTANILQRSRLSVALFLCVTPSMGASAFEVMARTGQMDWFVLSASFFYMIANISAGWINRPEKSQ